MRSREVKKILIEILVYEQTSGNRKVNDNAALRTVRTIFEIIDFEYVANRLLVFGFEWI